MGIAWKFSSRNRFNTTKSNVSLSRFLTLILPPNGMIGISTHSYLDFISNKKINATYQLTWSHISTWPPNSLFMRDHYNSIYMVFGKVNFKLN